MTALIFTVDGMASFMWVLQGDLRRFSNAYIKVDPGQETAEELALNNELEALTDELIATTKEASILEIQEAIKAGAYLVVAQKAIEM